MRCAATVAIAVFALSGCGDSPPDQTLPGTRETLPDGTIVVRYPALPLGEVLEIVPEFRLGAVEADPYLSFGDIRGIDVASDGTIYVLDYLASEVRAFDAEGRFLRLVATKGEGPGEISEANGMTLVGDSILWVQDHGKWTMIALSLEGEELERRPMHVRSYSYMWNGIIDRAGRFWKPTSHSDEERRFPPEEGLNEGTTRAYWKSHDPATGAADSVYMGETTFRTLVKQTRGGWSYRGVPFQAGRVSIADPDGGFWQAHTGSYRVARLDERGDTTLVIEADVRPAPVTAADHEAHIETVLEFDPDGRAGAEEALSYAPDTKPVITRLQLDDLDRLWVGRVVPDGETPLYDVFDAGGTYLGSVRFGFEPNEYLPLRFRYGKLYALEQDDLDIPFVVRAPVPPELEAATPTESASP